MIRKRKVRELAMQILYLWDTHGQEDRTMAQVAAAEATDDVTARQTALDVATAVWNQRQLADAWAERIAPQWPSHRRPIIDRNLLRMAIWELTNTATPPKVVIDEAIELAKAFSTEQSAAFVNGVLDAVLKEHQALTAGVPTPTEQSEIQNPES